MKLFSTKIELCSEILIVFEEIQLFSKTSNKSFETIFNHFYKY